MEFIEKSAIKALSNPGVVSHQLLNPENSGSERVTITRVGAERRFFAGDVARFADGDVHGLRNDSGLAFEYMSITSPPINFRAAYAKST